MELKAPKPVAGAFCPGGRVSAFLFVVLVLSSCTGTIADLSDPAAGDEQPPGSGGSGGSTVPAAFDWATVSKTAARRLTVAEVDNALRDLLGDSARQASLTLPEDPHAPFDNDYTVQRPSALLVEDLESLAETVVGRAMANPAAHQRIVDCAPKGAADTACLASVIAKMGRRIFRRPLEPDEVDAYVKLFGPRAMAANSFDKGVELALRAFLNDPEFIYRLESGAAVPDHPGVYRLSRWEVATRLSFLMLGTVPDDALLDLAAASKLETPGDVRAVAEKLLEDRRGQDAVKRFHGLWLGYEAIADGGLGAAMKAETAALIQRVIFERNAPWQDLFSATETFVDSALARNYGLPAPGPAARWVSYGGTGRRGLLSHGSFLSGGSKPDGTHPVLRGKLVRNSLLCQDIPLPDQNKMKIPPLPPDDPRVCKVDALSAHGMKGGACSGCHLMMDPIGFGLEAYDGNGKFRTAEPKKPQCKLDNLKGTLMNPDMGPFRGPGELGELLVKSGLLQKCLVTQFYRYAQGRHESADEQAVVDDLARQFVDGDRRFHSVVLGLAGSGAFLYRRD